MTNSPIATLPAAFPRRSYAWFPWAIVGSLAAVIAVNAVMIWFAASTFPGQVNAEPYEVGTGYNHVLEAARHQSELGWQLMAHTHGRTIEFTLIDRTGAPIADAEIAAQIGRPIGPPSAAQVRFIATAPGRYQAADAIPASGQWDATIDAAHGANHYRITVRVVAQ